MELQKKQAEDRRAGPDKTNEGQGPDVVGPAVGPGRMVSEGNGTSTSKPQHEAPSGFQSTVDGSDVEEPRTELNEEAPGVPSNVEPPNIDGTDDTTEPAQPVQKPPESPKS